MLLALIIILLVLSLLVCIYDWRSRIIPNYIVVCIFSVALVAVMLNGHYSQLINLMLFLPIAIALWKFGIWGAGDSKLLLAFFPMISSQYYIATICFIGLIGFITALIVIAYNRINKNKIFNSVPYGIPIALSCFLTSIASL